MTTANPFPTPEKPSGGARSQWLRFALPLIVISLLIGAIGVVGYRYLSDEIRRETHRTLAVIAEQKRQQIEAWLGEARVDADLAFYGHSQLELLFSEWSKGERKDPATLKRMQGLMEEMAKARGWAGLAVVDAEMRPAIVVDEADIQQHAELVRDILRRPRVELVDLHRNAQGNVQYGVLAPIGSPDMVPLGVAYVTWRPDQTLNPLVESWPVPTRTAETYLVRRDGDGVRFLTPLRFRPDATLSLTLPLSTPEMPAARAARGERGIIEGGLDYRRVPVLAYASAVGGTPWLMIAEIDEVEAYAGLRTMTWATSLVVGLGLLLAYSAGYLLWRRGRQRQELAALQAQRAAEARFRVVFEQAPLGVALMDPRSGRIMEANLRFAEIVGRTQAELVGLDALEVTHPDDVPDSVDHIARLTAGKISGYRLNKRYIHADGSVVWASVTCAPVRVDPETAPRYLFIVEDITARRQMEERLQVSEQRHRLLADNAIDVILTTDLAGRYSYVSPSVEKLLGFGPDEIVGHSMEDVLAPGSLPIAEAYFKELRADLLAGRPLSPFRAELEQRRKDGSTVWTDVTASPLLNTDGSFVEILGVARDISERKRYEHDLRQVYDAAEAANAAKSEFLANMSHEIRTPMNAILGLTQIVSGTPLDPQQADYLRKITAAGRSLLGILDDILDFSKVEAGKLVLMRRELCLDDFLDELASVIAATVDKTGVEIAFLIAPDVPHRILGDAGRLRQVLINLLRNAVRFTDQGEIVLSIEREEERSGGPAQLRFSIRDTGIGIAADQLGHIVELAQWQPEIHPGLERVAHVTQQEGEARAQEVGKRAVVLVKVQRCGERDRKHADRTHGQDDPAG